MTKTHKLQWPHGSVDAQPKYAKPRDVNSYAYRLENVSRIYESQSPVQALRSCNLTIAEGEFVGVVGRSGSGKSTLLNLLGLLDAPSSGRMLIDGCDVSEMPDRLRTEFRRSTIGFVFQSYYLLPHRTVLDNVCLQMIYQGVRRIERNHRAMTALSRVGLDKRSSSLPSILSGGEAQRVAIARAISSEPAILLCDEPTGNLDDGNTEQITELLDELNHDGLTIVIVTHDTSVAAHARHIVRLSDGQITDHL